MLSISQLFYRNIVKINRGNYFYCLGRMRLCQLTIKGNNNIINIAKNTKMRRCKIIVTGSNNRINIGEKCELYNTTIHIDNIGGNITIGSCTSVAGATMVSYEPHEITIGSDCMLSYGIEIRNTDSHKIINVDSGQWLNQGRPIHIESHVWLAARCTILKGANIGHDSIIGANSVVSGNIPSHVIATGQPAKIIRENVSWNRESVIPNK